MNERRSSVRWQINYRAKVKLGGTQAFEVCIINDISFKGLRVSLSLILPKDTIVKLSVVLSKGIDFEVKAWVAWRKARDGYFVYGLYFENINEADKGKIYRFLRGNFPGYVNRELGQGLIEEKGGEEMEDRRIFERIPINFPLRYLEIEGGKEGRAQAEDISAKGIGLVANEDLAPRTPLEMWIQVPDEGEPLYTRGEVVWSRRLEPDKFRIGANLEKADLMRLSRVLRAA